MSLTCYFAFFLRGWRGVHIYRILKVVMADFFSTEPPL